MTTAIRLFALVVGLTVFGYWMSIIGNPHVVETIIGLILALGSGLLTWYKLGQFVKRKKAAKQRQN